MIALLAIAALGASPDTLRCSVRPDRIDITLPRTADRRIGSLAVVRGRRWVALVDDRNHFASFHPGTPRVSLRPSRQVGAIDGRVTRAFPRAGTYRIVFADNLETEPDNMISLDCLVHVR